MDNLPTDFGYATTEVWALHPKDKQVITKLLYNYIKTPPIRINLAGKMEGSTGRQRLPRHVIETLKIPLPPLLEQKKIAATLSAVQSTKEKTEDVIQATKELKKSLIKHLFTYGPVPVEEAENVPLKETETGMVPEEWGIVEVGEVFEFSRKPRNLEIKNDDILPFIPMELISEDSERVNGWQMKKYSDISSGTDLCF